MARMPGSSGSHQFSQIPRAEIQRSSFDRSRGYKTTLDPAYLYPVFFDEVLPGDTYSVSMTGFARLSTPLKPIMDNAYFNTFFFFVPNRLVWDNWQRLNGEQTNPGDSTDYLVPEIIAPAGGFAHSSIYDYFGLPVGAAGVRIAAFHFRAYNLIWNEWFRDENLQARVVTNKGDGPDTSTDYTLLKRGKRHDYFTSSLPWPQKGESVSIPLGTTAPILANAGGMPVFHVGSGGPTNLAGTTGNNSVTFSSGQTATGAALWSDPQLHADLSTATAATINQLRQAFQIQRLYERDARGGTRYTEIVRSHFGVVSPDARLQRPEYLGGGQSDVNVSPIAQTGATRPDIAETTPQGNLAAIGTSTMHGHGFSKSFTEHGVLVGLICVRADLSYQQGLNRMWSRRSRFDFYWPALSHIGEQAVLSQEIFCDGTAADQTVFGYQERYAEYRYAPSVITGQFRSSDPESLDVWHLSQDFSTRPLLNPAFIQENPPFTRVVAVPNEPIFIFDSYFRVRCARPMPVYGVPGMIDHF
ncbi:MAG: major capsid protein [Microviridae sp.]|nr:MAG: major capsid protein [Microviridae sp.]